VIQSQPNEDASEFQETQPKGYLDLPFQKTPSKTSLNKKNSQVRASLEKNQVLRGPTQNAEEQEVATPTDSDNEPNPRNDHDAPSDNDEVRATEDESVTIIHFASQIGALSNDNMRKSAALLTETQKGEMFDASHQGLNKILFEGQYGFVFSKFSIIDPFDDNSQIEDSLH